MVFVIKNKIVAKKQLKKKKGNERKNRNKEMRVGEGVEGRGGEDVNLIQKIDGCKTF